MTSYTKTCNTCGKAKHKTHMCKKGMCIDCHYDNPCSCDIKLPHRRPVKKDVMTDEERKARADFLAGPVGTPEFTKKVKETNKRVMANGASPNQLAKRRDK